ncbi:MAG: ferredoxin-thioredoxin reductase catalytic domain-containing protein [Endomicrobiales bacterium]|jgi:ferredoxin-thioredoxin reductase catalytic subunit
MSELTREKIEAEYQALKTQTEQAGYHLNPDEDFVRGIVQGLLENEQRYGYQSCPCRLSSGRKDDDRDIICPCNYRDADVMDYGSCYCALYVSEKVFRGEQQVSSIPERRPPLPTRIADEVPVEKFPLSIPVWRCTVCGYLCARENPPEVCPICKAKQDRFKRFM